MSRNLSTALKFADLCVTLNHAEILRGVSGELRRGEVTGILGPNGCGKTTLLRVLCRLIKADSGSITADQIDEIISEPDLGKSSGAVGKLIADYRWRVAAVIDSEQLFGCYEGSTVTLRVRSDPTPIEAEIISITDSGRGDGTSVYVFECDTLTSSVVSGRTAQFKYIVNSYGGLRVSRSALRFNDEQERGVFVVVGGKLVFKKINVEYWGDDYLICTQEDDGDYLKLYDRIVTEGKDLYEGKVVE